MNKDSLDLAAKMDHGKTSVCVLDASTYVGFWILKGLLNRGYFVHAAIQKNGKFFSFSWFLVFWVCII